MKSKYQDLNRGSHREESHDRYTAIAETRDWSWFFAGPKAEEKDWVRHRVSPRVSLHKTTRSTHVDVASLGTRAPAQTDRASEESRCHSPRLELDAIAWKKSNTLHMLPHAGGGIDTCRAGFNRFRTVPDLLRPFPRATLAYHFGTCDRP